MGSIGESLQSGDRHCIPEKKLSKVAKHLIKVWSDAEKAGERYFPHEFMYKMLLSGDLEQYYEIDPRNSWMLAAMKKHSHCGARLGR